MARLREKWQGSLRFRLLVLGLTPLLVAFPFVVAVLVLVGGGQTYSMMLLKIRSSLAGTRNYLDQARQDAGGHVEQLVKSARVAQALHEKSRRELDQTLESALRGTGLDFLVVARPDGEVIGATAKVTGSAMLPDSYVVRQARIGVANTAYERIDGAWLGSLSPDLQARSTSRRDDPATASPPQAALMIHAAAHFPLATDGTDAILFGGVMLDQNQVLIEHLREIIFPIGTLPDNAEGHSMLYVDGTRATVSRKRGQGLQEVGVAAAPEVQDSVLKRGEPWLGSLEFNGELHVAGFDALIDGDGRRIGMLGAAFPQQPYRKIIISVLGAIAALFALTLLAISLLFLRVGGDLNRRLKSIADTMTLVSGGERSARVGIPAREDELGQLARHFDSLLETISAQDEVRRAALKTVVDEASRRRALFEHERDGVLILDAQGHILEANPKCSMMLGYLPSELTALRPQDWDAAHAPTELVRMLESVSGDGLFYETLHRRKDGSTYPAEVSVSRAEWGNQTFRLFLQRDITARKAAEAELADYRANLERLVLQRTSELNARSAQLNAIFALSPDGFVSFDAMHRVSFANAAFLRMTGLTAEEALGTDESEFSARLGRRCTPGAAFPGVATLRAAREQAELHAHAPPRRQLIEIAGPGNRILEFDIRLARTGEVSQILYFRDVTHETEVDRMKSEFLSTAAHELRTPMQSIFGYAELLTAQEFDEEFQGEMLDSIHRNSLMMISLINELLDLARIEARQGKDFVVERVVVLELLTETIRDFKPPSGREPPRVADAGDAPTVHADRNKMRQVLLNVLSNAYKYSPEGGPVDVALHRSTSAGKERIGIEIRDQGIGMTPEQLAHVGERFYRADASGKVLGAGLGMAIVKEIVELHGGEIEIRSEAGAGTRVTVWLALPENGENRNVQQAGRMQGAPLPTVSAQ